VIYPKRFAYAVAGFLGVDHPSTWRLCQACGGRPRAGGKRSGCNACSDTGFRLTRRHNAYDTPAPAPTGGQDDDNQTPGA
jgi:hypothetical protein